LHFRAYLPLPGRNRQSRDAALATNNKAPARAGAE